MKKPNIIMLLVLIGLVLGGVLLTNINKHQAATPEDSQISNAQQAASEEDAYAPDTGNYRDYDPALLANADMGSVVLFFKAGWCPTCTALDRDIVANLNMIPESVTILKVDYDTATALKKKYNVKVQHTLVQIDSQGNEIKQWQGSLKLQQLLSEIV
jgi:thioredoxin 1